MYYNIVRDMDATSIGIITRPFAFEGEGRIETSDQGIKLVKDKFDTLIVIPNDHVLNKLGNRASLTQAFEAVDDILRQAVSSVSDLIVKPRLLDINLSDFRSIFSNGGVAYLSMGEASGDDRASDVAEQVVMNDLLEITINGAEHIFFNVTGGSDLALFEVNKIAEIIKSYAHPDVNLIFGAVIDPDIKEKIRVTLIAAGFRGNVVKGSKENKIRIEKKYNT